VPKNAANLQKNIDMYAKIQIFELSLHSKTKISTQ